MADTLVDPLQPINAADPLAFKEVWQNVVGSEHPVTPSSSYWETKSQIHRSPNV